MVWNEKGEIDYALGACSIRREVESSLRRLRVDVIDLYQIHWPVDDLADTETGWETLSALRKEGKARWIGVSNFSVEELEAAQRLAPITSLQPPYLLIRREVEEGQLPFCQREGIGVIAHSPMGSGLLTGAMTRERIRTLPSEDWRSRNPEFQEPKLTHHLAPVDRLRTVAGHRGRIPGEVAIAWTLHHPAVTAAIAGAHDAGQLSGVIGGADLHLSAEEISMIENDTAVGAR